MLQGDLLDIVMCYSGCVSTKWYVARRSTRHRHVLLRMRQYKMICCKEIYSAWSCVTQDASVQNDMLQGDLLGMVMWYSGCVSTKWYVARRSTRHGHVLLRTSYYKSPHGLTFTWWGCYSLCLWHKPTEPALSFLFCSCIYFCRYGPFNCISFHKFSKKLSVFSLCSSGLISALLVLSTMSDVSPLSGISGLSFDSTLLSPLLFFCLVLLPFLSYRFLPAGPFF